MVKGFIDFVRDLNMNELNKWIDGWMDEIIIEF